MNTSLHIRHFAFTALVATALTLYHNHTLANLRKDMFDVTIAAIGYGYSSANAGLSCEQSILVFLKNYTNCLEK